MGHECLVDLLASMVGQKNRKSQSRDLLAFHTLHPIHKLSIVDAVGVWASMNVLNDIDATFFEMREKEAQRDLVLLHRVTTIIDDEIEVSAKPIDELLEFFPTGLISYERLNPIAVILAFVINIDAVDLGIGKVLGPHGMGVSMIEPDLQDLSDLKSPLAEIVMKK